MADGYLNFLTGKVAMKAAQEGTEEGLNTAVDAIISDIGTNRYMDAITAVARKDPGYFAQTYGRRAEIDVKKAEEELRKMKVSDIYDKLDDEYGTEVSDEIKEQLGDRNFGEVQEDIARYKLKEGEAKRVRDLAILDSKKITKKEDREKAVRDADMAYKQTVAELQRDTKYVELAMIDNYVRDMENVKVHQMTWKAKRHGFVEGVKENRRLRLEELANAV